MKPILRFALAVSLAVPAVALAASSDFGPAPLEAAQPGAQFLPVIASDERGLLVVYRAMGNDTDGQNRWWTFRARRAGFDGISGPERVIASPTGQLASRGRADWPQTLAACGQGALLSWYDGSAIQVQVLDSEGSVKRSLTVKVKKPVLTSVGLSCNAKTALLAWSDGGLVIHGALLPLGTLVPRPLELFADERAGNTFGPPVVASDGAQFLVAWPWNTGAETSLAVLPVSPDGKAARKATQVATGYLIDRAPAIASAAPGNFLISNGKASALVKLKADGRLEHQRVDIKGDNTDTAAVAGSAGRYVLVRLDGANTHVEVAGVGTDGAVRGPLKYQAKTQFESIAAAIGNGHLFALVVDRVDYRSLSLVLRSFSMNDEKLVEESSHLVSHEPGRQGFPRLAASGTDFLVAWTESGAVRAARVRHGALVDPAGIAVAVDAVSVLGVAADPTGWLVYVQKQNGAATVHVSYEGTVEPLGEPSRGALPSIYREQWMTGYGPRACATKGDCLQIWSDTSKVLAVRVIDGKPENDGKSPRVLSEGEGHHDFPALAAGKNGYLAAWLIGKEPRRPGPIGLRELAATGAPRGGVTRMGDVVGTVQVAFDGSRYVVGWSESTGMVPLEHDALRWACVGEKPRALGVDGTDLAIAANASGEVVAAWLDGPRTTITIADAEHPGGKAYPRVDGRRVRLRVLAP